VPRWSKNPKDKIKVGRGTLRKHAVSHVWYYQFKDVDGRWKSVTTGHTDKTGATDWALGHGLEITRIEKGIIKPEEKVSNDSIEPAAKEWLDYVKTQRSAGTYRTYTSCVNNLKAYLATRPAVRRLDQFNAAEVLRYRDWLLKGQRQEVDKKKGKTNQKKTADNNLVVLRAFFNYCVEMNKMRANPVHEKQGGVQLFFNERKPTIETYTRMEYAKIVQHAKGELKQKVRLLAASGLRIDEVAHLEYSDIDLRRGWLHVRTKITCEGRQWTPKDKTDRKLPLNADLRAVVDELRAAAGENPTGYLFPGTPGAHRAKNFARSTLLGLKALSTNTVVAKKKLTSHNFRRYFVSQCADCGIDMLCVMEWVGHDDWEMVRRYYRLRDEHAQDAMSRFTTGKPAAPVEGRDVSSDAPARPFGGSVGEGTSETSRAGSAGKSQTPPAA
jgi:integrase